jgi:hypothetical protein
MPVSMTTSSNFPSLKNCKKNHIPLKESSAAKTILNPNTHSCSKHRIWFIGKTWSECQMCNVYQTLAIVCQNVIMTKKGTGITFSWVQL